MSSLVMGLRRRSVFRELIATPDSSCTVGQRIICVGRKNSCVISLMIFSC
jgi:hypothetical protein